METRLVPKLKKRCARLGRRRLYDWIGQKTWENLEKPATGARLCVSAHGEGVLDGVYTHKVNRLALSVLAQ